MPYCRKCGKNIETGKICEVCLPQLQNMVQQPRPEPTPSGFTPVSKQKKKKTWVIIPVAAVLVVAVAATAILMPKLRSIHENNIAMKKQMEGKEAAEAKPYSGTCENGLTWELDADTGKLVVGGAEAIADYSMQDPAPWAVHSDEIKSIEVQSGVTTIGDNAFEGCSAVTEVSIPEGVTTIGTYAFAGCSALPQITLPETLTLVEKDAFAECTTLSEIHHTGSLSQWQAVQVDDGNQELMSCTIDFAKEDPAPQGGGGGGGSNPPLGDYGDYVVVPGRDGGVRVVHIQDR